MGNSPRRISLRPDPPSRFAPALSLAKQRRLQERSCSTIVLCRDEELRQIDHTERDCWMFIAELLFMNR